MMGLILSGDNSTRQRQQQQLARSIHRGYGKQRGLCAGSLSDSLCPAAPGPHYCFHKFTFRKSQRRKRTSQVIVSRIGFHHFGVSGCGP